MLVWTFSHQAGAYPMIDVLTYAILTGGGLLLLLVGTGAYETTTKPHRR